VLVDLLSMSLFSAPLAHLTPPEKEIDVDGGVQRAEH